MCHWVGEGERVGWTVSQDSVYIFTAQCWLTKKGFGNIWVILLSAEWHFGINLYTALQAFI